MFVTVSGRSDVYSKRQAVNESNYINSLAHRYIWSTIKTLPATLPELRLWSECHAPRTGVTDAGCWCRPSFDLMGEHLSQFTEKSFEKIILAGGNLLHVGTAYGEEVVGGLTRLGLLKNSCNQKNLRRSFSKN